MTHSVSFSVVSEDSLLLTWALDAGQLPPPSLAKLIGSLGQYLLSALSADIVNVVPAYNTLLVQRNILTASHEQIFDAIQLWLEQASGQQQSNPQCHQIPVWYHAKVAPDLESVCAARGLNQAELIALHTNREYTVFAVGFQPGFAYLGYVDKQLETARHASFRAEVAAGSVAIADRQTAVYPTASPGGWQVIGQTPNPPSPGLLAAGDTVRFFAIDHSEYRRLSSKL